MGGGGILIFLFDLSKIVGKFSVTLTFAPW